MTLLAAPGMAKKKAAPARADDRERKPMVVQIRGSEAYKAWAEKMARADGLSLAGIFDRAMRRYVKDIMGVGEPPPER